MAKATVGKKRLYVLCAYILFCFGLIVTHAGMEASLNELDEQAGVGPDHSESRKQHVILNSRIIWPEDARNDYDRIVDQITFQPRSSNGTAADIRLIYLSADLLPRLDSGRPRGDEFCDCIVNNCKLTVKSEEGASADAVIVYGQLPPFKRHATSQIWIFHSLESPVNTPDLSGFGDGINWTATYRHDSDIVTPYGKFLLYDNGDHRPSSSKATDPAAGRNYAAGKTRMAAWFASNCFTQNQRVDYVNELSRFMPVDIYGNCGRLRCGRYNGKCPQMLRERYKFYLAFENSNCREYISEKLFLNAFRNDIIPVVMGAPKQDYERIAPPHSFIHVEDFAGPQQLAVYLQTLHNNDSLYNSYFEWKLRGEFIDTRFWCRVCALLNEPKSKHYDSIERWWRPQGICTTGRWSRS